jgi:hypothetical protein
LFTNHGLWTQVLWPHPCRFGIDQLPVIQKGKRGPWEAVRIPLLKWEQAFSHLDAEAQGLGVLPGAVRLYAHHIGFQKRVDDGRGKLGA